MGTSSHFSLRRRTLALGGLAAAIGAPIRAQTKAPVKVRFQCDWRFEAGTTPYVVALKKGYFAEEGLDVTLNVGAGASATVTRMASGNFEMGTGDLNSLAEFAGNNGVVPARAVMLMYQNTPAAVFSLKKTGITRPADLRGRTLAAPAGDGARRIFPLFAAANGLDPATDVNWTAVDPAMRETMLSRGQVEVITGYLASGMLSLLRLGVAASDVHVMKYAEYGVALPGNAVLASQNFLNENPQAVAGFLRALTRALKESVADRAAAVAVLKSHEPLIDTRIEAQRLDLILDQEIGTPAVRRNGVGDIDIPQFQKGIDSLAKFLAFKSTPDAKSLVDTRFLPPQAQRMVFPA